MSEEEVIKQLKKACIFDENCYEVDCLFEDDLKAIRGLFDLYNEEKAKNKMLEANGFRNGLYSKDGNYICKDEVRDLIYDLENEIDFDGKLTELDSYCLLRAIINKLDEIIENE